MGIRDGREWDLYPDEPKGLFDEPVFKAVDPSGGHVTRGLFRPGPARRRTLGAIGVLAGVIGLAVVIVLIAMLVS